MSSVKNFTQSAMCKTKYIATITSLADSVIQETIITFTAETIFCVGVNTATILTQIVVDRTFICVL